MMHRNQIWFHGTTAGIIYHLKDPFNASQQFDQSPELKKQTNKDLRLCRPSLRKQMSSNEEGQVSKKEIMTLVANYEWEPLANLMW